MKQPCVYILASRPYGTLYIGVTSEVFERVGIHKQDLVDGFTKRYGVHRLVYYEMHETMEDAIRREKRIKEWKRVWKIRLIESMNPKWIDLIDETCAILDGPADIARRTANGSIVQVCGDPGLRRDDGRGTGEIRNWSPFTIQPEYSNR